jgi:hypothetical protein
MGRVIVDSAHCYLVSCPADWIWSSRFCARTDNTILSTQGQKKSEPVGCRGSGVRLSQRTLQLPCAPLLLVETA